MEIKLPSVRVELNNEEGLSLGKLSVPLIVGFGVHWSWMYLVIFSNESLFFHSNASPSQTSELFSSALLGFSAIMLFAYGVGSFLMRRLFSTRQKRSLNRIIGATLSCTGILLITLADSSTVLGTTMTWVSGVVVSIGAVVLLMSYGVSCAQCDMVSASATTTMALVLGVVLYALLAQIATLLPGLVFAITAVTPLIECYCLHRSSSLIIDHLKFANLTLRVHKPAFAAHICLFSLLLGFALGALRGSAIFEMFELESDSLRILVILVACLFISAFMLLSLMTQRLCSTFLFRSLMLFMPPAVLGYVFCKFLGTALQNITLLSAYLLFECVMWIYFSDIAQRYRISPFVVFGFGNGALMCGTLLGDLAMKALGFTLPAQLPMLAFVFAAMLIAYVVIPQESSLRNMIVKGDNSSSDLRDSVYANDLESKNIHSETARVGWFKLKCSAIAKRYQLSQRETEVLYLLAKGRNAVYIQEHLYISEGTARTHMRHIYKKLEIHTQQNLIELVDSVELPFTD